MQKPTKISHFLTPRNTLDSLSKTNQLCQIKHSSPMMMMKGKITWMKIVIATEIIFQVRQHKIMISLNSNKYLKINSSSSSQFNSNLHPLSSQHLLDSHHHYHNLSNLLNYSHPQILKKLP